MPVAKKSAPPLGDRLALFHFLLGRLGFKKFDDLANIVKLLPPEDDNSGASRYCQALCAALPGDSAISREMLESYDANIRRHTESICANRDRVRWRHFQWLILLFTEMYLSRYFGDADALARDLEEHRANKFAGARLTPYAKTDLEKVALWSATGSGKTLLMHVNLSQYRHYSRERGRRTNNTILLAPNDGLARQHLDEFRRSGIAARIFAGDSPSLGVSGDEVKILTVHQLKEKSGEKTVAVERFEGGNFVLVDEGHRGAGGKTWWAMREKLTAGGFSFEYSATFGQMSNEKRDDKQGEYAKNILFDYAYHRFHGDGYGKDYRIYNMQKGYDNPAHKRRYMTACLLKYYQQLSAFERMPGAAARFGAEKPLWTFVGRSVNAVESGRSDVLDIARFFRRFIGDADTAEADIRALLRDEAGLLNAGEFGALHTEDAEKIRADILARVFNSDGGGALHLALVGDAANGEIALYMGAAAPFGVINIGDAKKFMNLCEDKEADIVADPRPFTDSLFRDINQADSQVNVLIGAKKFTEGWNSWRVSTMGLMNVGKTEGTEIIQLFGRGVRLRGWGGTLQRRRFAPGAPADAPAETDLWETLNVFGLRAKFMETFRDYMRKEGMPEKKPITIPVLRDLHGANLKIIRTRKTGDFRRERIVNIPPPEKGGKPAVDLDWRPRVAALIANGGGELAAGRARCVIPDEIKRYFDRNRIYEKLQERKAESGWHNLALPREIVDDLLANDDWYSLQMAEEDQILRDFDEIRVWEDIAAELMKRHIRHHYKRAWAKWEGETRRYETLTEDDPNMIREYVLLAEAERRDLFDNLAKIRKQIEQGALPDISQIVEGLGFWDFKRHLYNPVLHISKECSIDVMPSGATLNDGEKEFLKSLETHYQKNPDFYAKRELYLLRNRSRGRGVGFFEANNFFPDFILWLKSADLCHIAFVDPKGLRQVGEDDAKVKFHKTIVSDIEKPMADMDPTARLHAFIISQTPEAKMLWRKKGADEYAAMNIFFADDPDGYVGKMMSAIVARN